MVCCSNRARRLLAGQALEVTCPFWSLPDGINASRKAKVLRSVLTPTFSYAVAVEFDRP